MCPKGCSRPTTTPICPVAFPCAPPDKGRGRGIQLHFVPPSSSLLVSLKTARKTIAKNNQAGREGWRERTLLWQLRSLPALLWRQSCRFVSIPEEIGSAPAPGMPRASLSSGGQTGTSPAGHCWAGEGQPGTNKAWGLQVAGKEQSCGLRAGSPPPSVQRFHEHGHNKAEMLKNKNNPAKGSQRVLLGRQHGLDARG